MGWPHGRSFALLAVLVASIAPGGCAPTDNFRLGQSEDGPTVPDTSIESASDASSRGDGATAGESGTGGGDATATTEAGADVMISQGGDAAATGGGADATISPGHHAAAADACSSEGGCKGGGCGPCGCTWGLFGAPEQILGLGLTGGLWAPSLSGDGKTLYLAMTLNGQEQIYTATRPDGGAMFLQAVALASVNSTSSDGTPFISYDGLTVYFYSTRPGGMGGRDLWFARRTAPTGDFAAAALLAGENSVDMDNMPWVSRDNLTLMFSSDRPGGPGGPDVFWATRVHPGDAFSAPVRVPGTAVDLASNDDRAVMTQDGLTIYFASNRGNSITDFDIWMATRPDTSSVFANAVSMSNLNAPGMDINVALSWDERELYFSSDRSGTQQIWRSVRQCM